MNIYGLLFTAALVCLPIASVNAEPVENTGSQPVKAKAEFINEKGKAIGEAILRQGVNGTLINLEINGLPPGPKAIHIHSTGTCEDHEHGFTASGGHLNPEGKKHGLMNPEGPDAGDLPNIYVHENGYSWAEMYTERASLDGSFGARILDDDGAALVIHENPDDHKTQPIGGAGSRIACGVIEPF